MLSVLSANVWVWVSECVRKGKFVSLPQVCECVSLAYWRRVAKATHVGPNKQRRRNGGQAYNYRPTVPTYMPCIYTDKNIYEFCLK